MSIVVRFHPSSLTAEQYGRVLDRLEDANAWPPQGLDYHVCFGSDGQLLVSEIWDSQEQLQAFGEQLMPILSDEGIEFAGEPDVYEVHNSFRR